jgi:hypothetical protein
MRDPGGMHSLYSLYGLRVKSTVPLPCPASDTSGLAPDVELVEDSQTAPWQVPTQVPRSYEDDGFSDCSTFQDGSAHMRCKEHFEFLVSGDGKQVRWRKLRDVPDEVLLTYLIGQMLSFCLLTRGVEPLHATAVVVDGGAIAFLGASGSGKSTLAAAFVQRGYALLTDDVLVLQPDGNKLLVHPSLPRLKLTPETADAFFCGRRSIPMNSFTTKMIFPLAPLSHSGSMVPLRALYVLPKRSSKNRILVTTLLGRASFLPLIANTFNDTVMTPARLKQQFAFASTITSTVPLRQLSFPRGLELLPAVADKILADLSQETTRRERLDCTVLL